VRRSFNKYGVSPKEARTSDGTVFASKWEKEAYEIIRDTIGVSNFTLQPSYVLQDKFRDIDDKAVRAIKYNADFLLFEEHIVDTKGFETDVFKMKEKMFKCKFPGQRIIKLKTKKQLREFLETLDEKEI
jgi:hypothetical protein